jgi:Flp pilus assembly protein TadD
MNICETSKEDQSVVRLRHLTMLAPADPELRLLLARALLSSSRISEAIEQIREAISLSPNHLEARKLLSGAMALDPS